jgi:hypothetical protein
MNDGQIPNFRVAPVPVSTGYTRVEGNRRRSTKRPRERSFTRNPYDSRLGCTSLGLGAVFTHTVFTGGGRGTAAAAAVAPASPPGIFWQVVEL